MARFAPAPKFSPREHHDWSWRMWSRMDRDGNGSISRRELDCEEFRGILRSCLTPGVVPSMGGATYERAEMNMNGLIHLCLRKADLNRDNNLSFEEFKAFMMTLREEGGGVNFAQLVFALFDLDSDGLIDQKEFREIFRFFLGHNAAENELQAEWSRLDMSGRGTATRIEFFRWMQTSSHEVFQRLVPRPSSSSLGSSAGLREFRGGRCGGGADSPSARPVWNQRFNSQRNGNDELPVGRRAYLSRPQSLPELTRHYETRKGFQVQLDRVTLPREPKKLRVLSTDTANFFAFNPNSGLPGGTMTSRSGEQKAWKDHWQTPLCVAVRRKPEPGTRHLRCPGQPPEWMLSRGSGSMTHS